MGIFLLVNYIALILYDSNAGIKNIYEIQRVVNKEFQGHKKP